MVFDTVLEWLKIADAWPGVRSWHCLLHAWEELACLPVQRPALVQQMNRRLASWPAQERSLWLDSRQEQMEPDPRGWQAGFLTAVEQELISLVRSLSCSPRSLSPAGVLGAQWLQQVQHWTVLLPWNAKSTREAARLFPALDALTFTGNLSGDGTWSKRQRAELLSFAATELPFHLRGLGVPGAELGACELGELMASPIAREVRRLALDSDGAAASVFDSVPGNIPLSELEELDLSGSSHMAYGDRLSNVLSLTAGLQSLSLRRVGIDEDRLIRHLTAAPLPRLRALSLADTAATERFLRWLAGSPLAATLRRVDLRRCKILRESAVESARLMLAQRAPDTDGTDAEPRLRIWLDDDLWLDDTAPVELALRSADG
ncbi:hypothetical protein WMF31_17615 [Sorangium sp. So ce1036]|uniref:hypothetical protein n=1 Tax=Sorangium sp. So ce1036 TaxID=3133328 RepID=UPI003EFD1912